LVDQTDGRWTASTESRWAVQRDEQRVVLLAVHLACLKAVRWAACLVVRLEEHWDALTASLMAAQWADQWAVSLGDKKAGSWGASRAAQRGHHSVALTAGPMERWRVVLSVGCWAGHLAKLWAGQRAALMAL